MSYICKTQRPESLRHTIYLLSTLLAAPREEALFPTVTKTLHRGERNPASNTQAQGCAQYSTSENGSWGKGTLLDQCLLWSLERPVELGQWIYSQAPVGATTNNSLPFWPWKLLHSRMGLDPSQMPLPEKYFSPRGRSVHLITFPMNVPIPVCRPMSNSSPCPWD